MRASWAFGCMSSERRRWRRLQAEGFPTMATVMKVRVHELAKQLGTTSARVLEVCRERGIAASTAASGLDPVAVEQIRGVLTPAPAEALQVDPFTRVPPS